MLFTDFVQRVSKIRDLPLPGQEAHFVMAPELRKRLMQNVELQKLQPKMAGVLALFYPDDELVTRFALILRKTYRGVHSGQVGLPGGKKEEEDHDFEATALRETEEEIGVLRSKIRVIKELTEVFIPPSNFVVKPYLGFTEERPQFQLQPDEVEDIIEVYLQELLEDANTTVQQLSTSYASKIQVPAYKLQGQVVWGATAMMLSELKELLRGAL